MVALELAQLLVQQGKKVGLLGLLDSQFPLSKSRHQPWRKRIYLSLRTPLHEARRRLRWKIIHAAGPAIRVAGLGWNSRLLLAYRRLVVHFNARANQSYRPSFYPGEITLFITAGTKLAHEDPRLMVRQSAQSTHIVAIPGERAGLFMKPAVDELAQQLQTCLKSAEKKNAP